MTMLGDIKIWSICAALIASPVLAELREMPEYLVDALMASTTAQAVALSCPELSVNPVAANAASTNLIALLDADGINSEDPTSDVLGAGLEFAARQQAFMDKHALEGANAAAVCAAGRIEIAENTSIGALLIEEGSK